MYFRQIHDAATNALTYLLADEESRDAIVIDPLKTQATLILALLAERSLCLRHVLRTHVHRPARAGCGELCPSTGATLILGKGSPDDIGGERVDDSSVIHCGPHKLIVIATPGHAPGSVCYLWQDRLFCGDTLLIRSCDCVGPDANPGLMFDSVKQKLFVLPDETLVFPGHDARGRTVSTIGEERRHNPAFAQLNREAFVAAASRTSSSGAGRTQGARLSHGQGAW